MKYLFALILSVGLIGCTTTDPYTGEQKASKTVKGAGIGAVAGAVLGAATGDNAKDRRERALKGGVIGGAIGGGVGNYMDRQEARLVGPHLQARQQQRNQPHHRHQLVNPV